MANNKQYSTTTTSDVATSTTAKTILAVVNGSTTDINIIGYKFTSDITSGEQYLVEVVIGDQFSGGTSTAESINKEGGTGNTSRVTSVQRNYTGEPATLTVIDSFYVPGAGVYEVFLPLGREITCAASKTFGLRVKATTGTPNVRAKICWEE